MDFGFADLDLSVKDLMTPEQIIQIGYPPLRIDIVTSIDGVDWVSAWKNKVTAKIDGLRLPFIGLRELVKNKKASGRTKDAADAEALDQ
jgi:hypothetical protein